ncbi:CDP-diacylglycerol--glycerol-3-phosphate 3-phosphatidyltransferase [Glycomyces algeriensis]|uniref:CDP-diacylglycerol--glycerol-3-phosphate 3-phosphatidyltransferase n=1 Tax=Glycomyces algeriensis TaxID=256037 RepID=A0A9W6LGK3_9ACTN|nr:CDP-diacylglycerol--glycerol-3-phosphate 3-phosphatidyltransferase [Glycomyces algeriensis]MDA1365357.1 CDP-diacylglycerol--glycerol-3-phosphate 3-phosphatidyltransferase [Glycomyces algeriensis]MDR7349579.1 CDP-diacylglycerol--glycerol-3-phosphate 3-phosphatidyltransferase [Glycomyces algeriensis]GLI42285.1 CDP-diacylglycerol--glycerol-3-phosphate 3-phosphatidyltransferase [Glycomyces algeriensis]
MTTEDPPVSPWNIANVVTVARIFLVPVFAVFVVLSGMEHSGWRMAACALFVFISATDFVDGWLARSRGLVTDFGKLADPIADKILIGASLILLSYYDHLAWWVTVVILLRELGITALRMAVLRRTVIAADRGGKLKTVLQITAVAWYLWPWPSPLDAVGPWLMGAALVLTVATGMDYLWKAFKTKKSEPNRTR